MRLLYYNNNKHGTVTIIVTGIRDITKQWIRQFKVLTSQNEILIS